MGIARIGLHSDKDAIADNPTNVTAEQVVTTNTRVTSVRVVCLIRPE